MSKSRRSAVAALAIVLLGAGPLVSQEVDGFLGQPIDGWISPDGSLGYIARGKSYQVDYIVASQEVYFTITAIEVSPREGFRPLRHPIVLTGPDIREFTASDVVFANARSEGEPLRGSLTLVQRVRGEGNEWSARFAPDPKDRLKKGLDEIILDVVARESTSRR